MPERDQQGKPLRVLLLNEFFWPDTQGGTATATSNIATRLQARHGFDVTVVTSRHAYRDLSIRYPAFEKWNGVSIYRVASPNWLRSSTAKRLLGNLIFALSASLKVLTMRRPNVVITTTAPLTLPMPAVTLKRFKGVPYAYIIYDLDPDRTVALKVMEPNSRAVRLLRRFQTKWLKGAASVVAIGRCMRDYLIHNYGLDPARVDVVEVGADPSIVPVLPKQTQFRRKHGLDGFVALYSGNFGQYHEFDSLLDAAEKLRDARKDIQFVLVGGGHKLAYVRDQVRLRGLSNVQMHDFVPEEELADLLATADVQIVTLEAGMEGICVPSKFYTSLASGRPILALMGPNGEVARTIEEESCGVRVEPDDASGIVAALERLASDSQLAEDMGKNARSSFERRFTTDVTVDRLADVLKRIAKSAS